MQPRNLRSTDASVTACRQTSRVARDTCAYVFEKPAGFTFTAGQAVDLMLPSQPDDGGMCRALSLVSAPYEDELVVATRLRDSAFKRGLDALPTGAPVELDGPFGSLILRTNVSRPAVFIAGGIGITPFVSILRQAAHERRAQALTLVYSNRQPGDAAFLAELSTYEQAHRGTFRLRATITATPPTGVAWHGDRGRIDAGLVNDVIVPPSAPVFYVAGPPGMVSGIRKILRGLRIPDDDIVAEDFSGY
jgi:ferredoxin-NADP reductase